MKRRRKEIISYKEEESEEESEESEEENKEDSDEEWSNDGDEQSEEEDGDQEWTDEQDDPADQPSTSESTSAPVMTDAPPVDIKQEPLSDDEGQHIPYQEDPDQFAESYKMLESLRRSCEQGGAERSSTGGPLDSQSASSGGEEDTRERGKFQRTRAIDVRLPPSMVGEGYLQQTGMLADSFTCGLCQKPCGNRTNYTVHLRIKHAKELPYECHVCEERFPTEAVLKDHAQTNHQSGDKDYRFKCGACGARFRLKLDLHAHMLSHNEYELFPCHLCQRTFSEREELSEHLCEHMKARNKRVRCPLCGKLFNRARNLAIHLGTHSATYICQLCENKTRMLECETYDDLQALLGMNTTALLHTSEENHIKQEEPSDNRETLVCKLCRTTFANVQERSGHHCKVYHCRNCSKYFCCPDPLDADGKPWDVEENYLCHTCIRSLCLMDKMPPDETSTSVDRITAKCWICAETFSKVIPTYHKVIMKLPSPNQSCSDDEPENLSLGLQCKICGNVYPKMSDLQKHYMIHELNHLYRCRFCDTIWDRKRMYRRHMQTHKVKPYRCPKCYKAFSNENRLRRHIDKHVRRHLKRKGEIHSDPSLIFSASDGAKKRFNKKRKKRAKGKMKKKSKRKVKTKSKKTDANAGENGDVLELGKCLQVEHRNVHQRKGEESGKYVCDICNLSCVNNLHLYNHKMVHAGQKIRPCDICGQGYRSNYELMKHKEDQHSQCHCQICGKGFLSTSDLEVHHKEKHVKDPLTCATCGKVCVNERHLENHRVVHTGRKLFVCEFCGQGFHLRYALVEHLGIHTGQKPHRCDICQQSFSQTEDLLQHKKLMHSQEHPGLVIGNDFIKKEPIEEVDHSGQSFNAFIEKEEIEHPGLVIGTDFIKKEAIDQIQEVDQSIQSYNSDVDN
nr:zinc finger protein 595-like isoform X2 [Lytechinus pictus]